MQKTWWLRKFNGCQTSDRRTKGGWQKKKTNWAPGWCWDSIGVTAEVTLKMLQSIVSVPTRGHEDRWEGVARGGRCSRSSTGCQVGRGRVTSSVLARWRSQLPNVSAGEEEEEEEKNGWLKKAPENKGLAQASDSCIQFPSICRGSKFFRFFSSLCFLMSSLQCVQSFPTPPPFLFSLSSPLTARSALLPRFQSRVLDCLLSLFSPPPPPAPSTLHPPSPTLCLCYSVTLQSP